MDSFDVDSVVIGAGVVGLAAARALALAGRQVLILESDSLIGSGISSRSSEVIHAGLYYPPGSLKAALCIEGSRRLYAYCREHRIGHRRCGKILVAPGEQQVPELERIAANAQASGAERLDVLTAAEARGLEPDLWCHAALLSPRTGIIDSHALMQAYLGEAEAHGAELVLRTPVASIVPEDSGPVVVLSGPEPVALTARLVVNAAGLAAPALAPTKEAGQPRPPTYFAKGTYFGLAGRSPFSHLIYPTPEPGGLGVHLTLDLAGQARFGPDVEWVEAPDFSVDPGRAQRFYAAVRSYWPALPDGALVPAYAGVRPKLVGPGAPPSDFVVSGPAEHGVPGVINLLGIESPGLTASMPLADRVVRMAEGAAV